ncbi:MAG: pyridoxamine 5'-phosphate oxidase family protein [Desulfocucumaceae bacterium]
MGCSSCDGECTGVLTPEMKDVISRSAFIPVTTVSGEGQPHLIVVGRVKEIRDGDILVLGVYKMIRTRQNLAETGVMQMAAVAEKKGFRFAGQGRVEDGTVIFKVEKADPLL